MPPADEVSDTDESAVEVDVEETKLILANADTAIDKIDSALPTIRDLEAGDKELDEIAELATKTFSDLVDLSMNVDPRCSGQIVQAASSLLGHAVTAKVAKLDKKLKMVDLQLKKANLDLKIKAMADKEKEQTGETLEGQGLVLDRNELLQSILGKKEETKK